MDTTLDHLGTNLKRYRKRLGLTQHALARAAACNYSTVAHYELGDIVPSLGMAVTLAQVLGISLDALVAEAPSSEAPRSP